ncbi:aminoglycoside phosphotransferase family protein [Streptomyces sp. NBC_01136]|uniref:phosphotransferase enzyme family protein n=1 Tax=unclassified Streptomyces TaxID=2593676 RepID=UPI00324B5137|nr:aminoglycoside phosphotransferase family protein [Streptomyces sp. NBC_01136]
MNPSQQPPQYGPFTESTAEAAVKAACGEIGAPPPSDLELLRIGENALFADPARELVYRVARSDMLTAKVDKELATARWLVAQGFPALPPRDDLPQPIAVEGRLVTFWEYAPPTTLPAPQLSDLARLLRALHALPEPDFAVPPLNPFPLMRWRLEQAEGVAEADLAFLYAACQDAEDDFHALVAADPAAYGLVHGDAHRGNLLRRGERVLLIDYEAVAMGPRAWDLLPTATAVDRFGLPPAEYSAFVDVYGADVTKHPGYRTLRTVRELGMTTWLMQNVTHSPSEAAEFALRMESLRRGDLGARWHAL